MACTFASSLTDSCTCLGTTEACGADSYCYEGQCKSENKCGEGLCTTECMCGGDGKIATKCLGDSKYCKNGKVMTLCTADSLAADECACQVGDDGVCMGRCAGGNCYGNGSCGFDVSSAISCVCTVEGKKVGVFKKTFSTVCRSTEGLVAIPGGCGDNMTIDQVCKCGNEEDDCASGSICSGSNCYSRKCAEGNCSCDCVGNQKNAEYCYDLNTNQCKGGKVVPLDNKLVCTDQHDSNSYCQCSSETATLCAVYGACADIDCYDKLIPYCPKDFPATGTCRCKYTKKIAIVAKVGDICNEDGTVTKICTNGVPNQRDACFCGSKNGPECKKGDVCIGGQCYGEADNATGKYCTDSNVCTTACACTDLSFSEAELCTGAFQKCENNAVVTLKCSKDAKKADACKCSDSATGACPSDSVCSSEVCYGPGEDKGICESDGFCSNACACIASSHTAKAAVVCSGEKQYCDSGVIRNVCTDRSINDKSCECTKGDSTTCAEDNVCIDSQCFGTDAPDGDFCSGTAACTTACACMSADGKTAEKCIGQNYYCTEGAIVLRCLVGQGKEDNECRACDTNCLECAESRSICTRCADKFKLVNRQCEKAGGIGAGGIVGIVIAVLVVIIVLIILILLLLKHRKQEKEKVGYQGQKEEKEEEDQVHVAAE